MIVIFDAVQRIGVDEENYHSTKASHDLFFRTERWQEIEASESKSKNIFLENIEWMRKQTKSTHHEKQKAEDVLKMLKGIGEVKLMPA
jgi:hypothetical protein